MHVEAASRREAPFRRRHRAAPPRVPYARRFAARRAPRPLKRDGGGASSATANRHHAHRRDGVGVVDKIVGGVIPQGSAAVKRAFRRRCHGERAAPGAGSTRRARDGRPHRHSSERAFKIRARWPGKAYMKPTGAPRADHGARGERPDDVVERQRNLNSRGAMLGNGAARWQDVDKGRGAQAELSRTRSRSLDDRGPRRLLEHFLLRGVPPHVEQKVIAETKREREEARP